MSQQTTKKVKYVGTQEFINADTGEIESMQVSSIEDRDFNFTKVWMRNLISTLDIVGNQKTKLCFWLIDNLNKENQINLTQRQIADKANISLQTVNITMKILLDADFLRRINTSSYMVNPDIMYKGQRPARLNLLSQYQDAVRVTLSDEEKLSNLLESINIMQKKAEYLQKQITKKKENNDTKEIA